ncbi:diaminopimelate decarboxylase [Halanaerobium congolense]|jgi:diaminopimelate decarboxylase|uniref:Diaminopimelate decarboxylase n=1 Tax=Halanaerobium congolense TaxID=54121 RepID=A0A1G6MBQ8_9FIRM|nr:diaminopimelate decarboxylase [Halanaerobium congolense]KXS49669.1 MAG: diaminopimelate decarboxylase [Halanaerobium sp. T82-1]PUU92162.1 MAG: diaminopimelate decarboxylase [Halanaerobium sp.]PTX17243.1 diaminopimelate decarboxylase [Halanaerobium congolense]TDP25668.1 diaminopimelate decarboxylase [Halanaerobium congolense]SDC52890.1 diaminopimelate decarboxylase [Halanaerobium congolense]
MKKITINETKIRETAKKYGTPFHIYDEKVILDRLNTLISSFDWSEFKEFFAIKANPNPHILKIMKDNNCGVDAATVTEIKLAEEVGFSGEDIMFTSNLTTLEAYKYAVNKGAIINIDYAPDIYELFENGIIPENICFRLNPGSIENEIMGDSKESKFGSTAEQIKNAVTFLKENNISSMGLHTMVVSNENDPKIFGEYTEMLFEFAREIISDYGVEIDFINIGGGIGIPYEKEQVVDVKSISEEVKASYNKVLKANGLESKIFMESGRYITGESGYLVTEIIKEKETYKKYLGVDASMSDLMRPAMYRSYHHLTNIDAEARGEDEFEEYDVIGSLCENNDKFAIDRKLPKSRLGDLIVIHDTGAHGHAMGFNYNGMLRNGEFLYTTAGEVKQIRRDENFEDYTTTIIGGY